MLKKVIFLISTFILVFFVHFLLQNETIYKYTTGKFIKNWININGERQLLKTPNQKISNENLIQWDAEHYQRIKNYGYNTQQAGGDYIFAFFPLFPAIWKISHLPPQGIVILNILFFCISVLWLSLLFKNNAEPGKYIFAIAVLLPSVVIFLIPYTEATFLLTITLGIYGFLKNNYKIYFAGFLLAALTRPAYTFLLLSVIGTEIYYLVQHKNIKLFLKNTFFNTLPLVTGTVIVSAIQWQYGSGSIFKFIEVQKYWNNVLSLPQQLRDWSHEGFAINIGVVFIIFVPAFVYLSRMFFLQIRSNFKVAQKPITQPIDKIRYLQILSLFYLIGSTLFIIFYRGGSLNCLFRFTLCTPFLYVLLFSVNPVSTTNKKNRIGIFGALSALSIFVLSVAPYSHVWNFSDCGIIIFLLCAGLWLFRDYTHQKQYKIIFAFTYLLNIYWTNYLFNMYIANGWIFA